MDVKISKQRKSHLIEVSKYEVPLPDQSLDESISNDVCLGKPPLSPASKSLRIEFQQKMNEDPTPRKSDINFSDASIDGGNSSEEIQKKR